MRCRCGLSEHQIKCVLSLSHFLDPAVISGRTGRVVINCRRPREPAARYEFGNDKRHRIANRHPVEFGSECEFRLTAQDLDPAVSRSVDPDRGPLDDDPPIV